MRELLLYTTLGCHLCEEAEAIVAALPESHQWRLRLVEIADDDALMSRYGIRIPVLYRQDLAHLGDTECELGWPFDSSTAARFLAHEE